MVPSKETQRIARLISEIRKEIGLISQVSNEALDVKRRFMQDTPGLLEIRGVAAIIHDFYNGVEKMFKRIAQELNGGYPSGGNWHRILLGNMATEIYNVRPQVISETCERALDEFLRFRHVFRHGYGFLLDWEKIRDLVVKIPITHDLLVADVEIFIDFLKSLID